MAQTGTIPFADTASNGATLVSRCLKILLVWTCLQLGQSLALTANAQVQDRVSFSVPPMIIVWSGNSSDIASGPGAAITSSSQSSDQPLITGTVVEAGPVLTSFNDLSLPSGDEVRWSVNIASNTAFNIDAKLISHNSVASNATIRFEWSHIGSAAQSPAVSGNGFVSGEWRTADLSAQTTIFRGSRKSAARRGSVADQSVTLEAIFSNADPESLQSLAADLEVTVYLP